VDAGSGLHCGIWLQSVEMDTRERQMTFETILWTWGILHTGVYIWAFMSKKR
jgi:hypothetical protein